MRRYIFLLPFILGIKFSVAKPLTDSLVVGCYNNAFAEIQTLLKTDGSFKEAIFQVENAYFSDRLDKQKFFESIDELKSLCLLWTKFNKATNYKYPDSINVEKINHFTPL